MLTSFHKRQRQQAQYDNGAYGSITWLLCSNRYLALKEFQAASPGNITVFCVIFELQCLVYSQMQKRKWNENLPEFLQ